MRILITGCSGYIGNNLVSQLKARGHDVIGIDRVACQHLELDDFILCDLLEPERYAKALKGIDHICHLAAAKGDWGISEAEYYRDNLEATRTLITAAQQSGPKQWIFYSTVSTLGPSKAPLSETAPRKPANAYGRSKAACERLFDRYVAETPGAHVVTIRPSVVFGPDNPWNTNIFRLIDAIYRNRFLMIGKGQEVKTTSYIENLLDAHIFLMDRQLAQPHEGHEVFHYVDEPAECTAELVANIREYLNKVPRNVHLPLAAAAPLALIGDAAAALTRVDFPITSARVRKFCTATNFSAQAIRDLGFVQRVRNGKAIQRTVEWYLSHYLRESDVRT